MLFFFCQICCCFGFLNQFSSSPVLKCSPDFCFLELCACETQSQTSQFHTGTELPSGLGDEKAPLGFKIHYSASVMSERTHMPSVLLRLLFKAVFRLMTRKLPVCPREPSVLQCNCTITETTTHPWLSSRRLRQSTTKQTRSAEYYVKGRRASGITIMCSTATPCLS